MSKTNRKEFMIMMTIIMAAVLGVLCLFCIVFAAKKHNSTGKTPIALVVLALVFAVVLLIVPFSELLQKLAKKQNI